MPAAKTALMKCGIREVFILVCASDSVLRRGRCYANENHVSHVPVSNNLWVAHIFSRERTYDPKDHRPTWTRQSRMLRPGGKQNSHIGPKRG
jgi:hypothetical protein